MTQPVRDSDEGAALPAEWPRELDGDFEVRGVLGRGGTAVVFSARDRARGREVAVKVFRPRLPGDVETMARAAREAAKVSRLRHPNIVGLVDLRRIPPDNVALITQLVPGRTLKAELANGPLAPLRAERVLRDVGSALEAAHKAGVIHGDVKPENIFLHDSGKAMLADFGVARVRDAPPELTATGTTIGTPRYMAPEQFGGVYTDPRSDLYGLGVVGWEMLTGKRAWAGESLRNVIHRQKLDSLPPIDMYRSDVPARLLYLIEGLMQKKPDQRWSTAGLFVSMLTSTTPPPGLDRWVEAQAARHRKAAVALGDAATETPAEPSPEGVRSASVESPTDETPTRSIWKRQPPPENLPFGVKMGVTIIVVVGALLVSFGPSWMRGSTRNAVAGVSTGEDSLKDVRRAAGVPRATPATTGSSKPATSLTPVTPVNRGAPPALPPPRADSLTSRVAAKAAGTAATTATVTSTGAVPGPRVTGGSTARTPRPGDTTAAIDSLFNQLTREDSAILATEGLRIDAATSKSVPALRSGSNVPPRSVIPRANSRSAGLGLEFPRETTAIAAGMRHSCMLEPTGRVLCWGSNQYGQLGDGSLDAHANPSPVVQGMTFAQISAGSWHTCGLTGGGQLACWGRNDAGQLGDGTTAGHTAPVRVGGASNFRAVRAGGTHTCAIGWDDIVRCWGSNTYGELGDGTRQPSSLPVAVKLPGAARTIATGVHHTCAILMDGGAYCWGRNSSGQLGNAATTDQSSPVAVAGDIRFVSIAAGSAHTCAIAGSGRAWCWGENTAGQLGAGSAVNGSILPLPLEVTTAFRSITAGLSHTCARGRDNRVWCWGRNSLGQLGNGTTSNQSKPTLAAGISEVVGLQATGSHTCGISAGGDVFCWGDNADGQVGDGNRASAVVPVRVKSPR